MAEKTSMTHHMSNSVLQVDTFPQALQVKVIENWLALGQVEEALKELDAMSGSGSPYVHRMRELIERIYPSGAC